MAEEVILGKDGIAEGAKPGTVVADASTIAPSDSRRDRSELWRKRVSNFWMRPVPVPSPAPRAAP